MQADLQVQSNIGSVLSVGLQSGNMIMCRRFMQQGAFHITCYMRMRGSEVFVRVCLEVTFYIRFCGRVLVSVRLLTLFRAARAYPMCAIWCFTCTALI